MVFLEVERRGDGDPIARYRTGRLAVVTVELGVGTADAGLGDLDCAGQGGEP